MSKENSPPPAPPSPSTHHRRASFSPGQTFSELFGRSPGNTGASSETTAFPGHIATAAANAQAQQRRRMSISTLGLSGSPTQTSPFSGGRTRGESYSSSGSGSPSIDESAVEEGDATPMSTPTTPFARRMSFGAKALRDVRSGNGNTPGRSSVIPASSPTAKGRGLSSSQRSTKDPLRSTSNSFPRPSGEGFSWSESLRSRAERTSSISASPITVHTDPAQHQRATSVAVVEAPVKEMPKTPKAPDPFQERILKGDFYMD
ncbi:MAG: hypothetical protein M1830_001664 [Pleopsidium flavum]|nr:MAG: hypothetical protein M1830_001664 [Pleopsidium flavum]